MKSSFDSSESPQPSRFVGHLAGRPLLVVGVTFAIGAVVTGALMVAIPMDAVGIVSTLATVWGLDLALVIYLLTAKDTDKLLAHIDALQEQLSAALEEPGPDAVVVEGQPQEAPEANEGTEGTGGSKPQEAPRPQEAPAPEAPSTQPGPAPAVAAGLQQGIAAMVSQKISQKIAAPFSEASQITEYMPAEYLEALHSRVGLEVADIARAWTPNPQGGGPWVVEDGNGDQWSVFQSRHQRQNRPTVIPLGNRERIRQRHDEKMEALEQMRQQKMARRADREEKMDRLRADREASHKPDDRSHRPNKH